MARTIKRRIRCAAALALPVGVAAVALARPFNYSIFPEAPAAVESRLASASLTLEDAIAQAKRVVGGGVVKSAEFVLPPRPEQPKGEAAGNAPAPDASAEPDEIDVLLYKDGVAHRITFNAATGEITAQERVPRFFGWEVSGEYTELPSFVRYFILKEGEGPALDADDAALATIVGYLADGTVFWDSRANPDGKSTLQFRQLVPGLRDGLVGARRGAKRKVIVPYTQGYGLFGSPPHVPSNATLIFDVEVHQVVKLDADGQPESGAKPKIPPPPPPQPGVRLPSPKPPPSGEKPPTK